MWGYGKEGVSGGVQVMEWGEGQDASGVRMKTKRGKMANLTWTSDTSSRFSCNSALQSVHEVHA